MRLLLAVVVAAAALGCERERRDLEPSGDYSRAVSVTTLHPGGVAPPPPVDNPAERNAYSMSEGKALFSAYNCSGCHANGGGGIGPALIDDEWIYGDQPEQIFRTILEGRPNGMPAFRQRVPDVQIWQLAAFVRAMGGLVPKDAAPGRDDHMGDRPAESSTQKTSPVDSSQPPASVQ